jgi:hypothetical protein
MDPWKDGVYEMFREFSPAAEWPPTPSAQALLQYLAGPGQLQRGSPVVGPEVGNIWLRPLRGGRWYTEKICVGSRQ